MAFLNKIEYRWSIVAALLTILLMAGCTKEDTRSNATPLRFSISTKIATDEKPNGTQISSTRLIVVDKSTMLIVFNQSTENGLSETAPGNQTYSLELKPGEYLTYIVANETESMKAVLNRVTNPNDLRTIAISGVFNETNIPFSGSQDFVLRKKLSHDGTLSSEVSIDGGGTWKENLEVSLIRTQCKVSLYLRKKIGSADEVKITKVELCNIPDQSYLIPKVYETANPQDRVVFHNPSGISLGNDVADGNEELASFEKIVDSGVIFPEKRMVDNTDASKATYLKIYATYGTQNPTYIVKLRDDLNVANYDLTRNVHYKVYGTITQTGEGIVATFELAPWKDGGTIDAEEPGGMYYLNLSDAYVTYPHKLYFDKNKNTFIKDADGNYISPVDFDYYCYFWTNKASSKVSITNFQMDQNPNESVGITNSMSILRDNTNGNTHDVMGKIDVHIPVSDILKGFQKSYFMNLKADKINRRLFFAVSDYDIIPEIIPGVTKLDDLVVTNHGTASATSTSGTFEIEAYLPLGSGIAPSVLLNPTSRYIKFTLTDITPAGGDVFSPKKFKVDYTCSTPRSVTLQAYEAQFALMKDTYTKIYTSPTTLSFTVKKK